MKRYFLAIIPTLALIGTGCDSSSPDARPSTATSVQDAGGAEAGGAEAGTIHVEVAPVADRALELNLTGLVNSYERARLFSRVEGFVTEVQVDIGDEVNQGQPLASLQVPELEAEVAERHAAVAQCEADYKSSLAEIDQAKARLAEMEAAKRLKEAEHKRISMLVEDGALNPQNLDEAVFGREAAIAARERADKDVVAAQAAAESTRLRGNVAKAALEKSDAMLNYATIRAPFDGVIVLRMVDRGDFVRPATNSGGEPLLAIARVDRLRLQLDVDLVAGALLDVGDQAVLHDVKGLPNARFEGVVSRYAAAFDEASRKMRAEVDLDNPLDESTGKRRLTPGYYGQVTLILATGQEAPSVPTDALGRDEQGSYVMLVQSGRCLRRPVRVLFETAMTVWLDGEIAPGNLVVVRNLEELSDGQQVAYDSPQLAASP